MTGAALTVGDRLAIADLLARYCHASDERDTDALRCMLTPDTAGDFGPAGVHKGREEVLAVSTGILALVQVTQHQVTTSVVTANQENGGGAKAKTDFTARHLKDGRHFTVGGVYHDELVRDGDGWLIAARRIVVTWTEGDPAVLGLAP